LSLSSALITGASSGLGRALALEFAVDGDNVLSLVGRRVSELEATADAVRHAGSQAHVLAADLSRPQEPVRAVEQTRAFFDPDVVIANAGAGRSGPVAELAWSDIEQMVRVNSLGAMALVRAALPRMIERRSGWIAAISSLASYRGFPARAPYAASKAALSTFIESVRIEARPHGVSVIDVHPGFIRTPMTAEHTFKMPFLMDADDAARRILRAIARRRAVYDFPWPMA